MINEDDEAVFQYLTNLVVIEYEDVKSGFKISFVSFIAKTGDRVGRLKCHLIQLRYTQTISSVTFPL